MTHSHVKHDSFTCGTWLNRMWDMTHSHKRHDAFMCETWLLHTWDMTHSCLRHDSFTWPTCGARVECMCDSLLCSSWLIPMWNMTHSHVYIKENSEIPYLRQVLDVTVGSDRVSRSLNPCLVGRRVVPTARWASKAHRVTSETQHQHCARSSVTNVLSLEQNTPQPTSLSNLLEIHEINFEENLAL